MWTVSEEQVVIAAARKIRDRGLLEAVLDAMEELPSNRRLVITKVQDIPAAVIDGFNAKDDPAFMFPSNTDLMAELRLSNARQNMLLERISGMEDLLLQTISLLESHQVEPPVVVHDTTNQVYSHEGKDDRIRIVIFGANAAQIATITKGVNTEKYNLRFARESNDLKRLRPFTENGQTHLIQMVRFTNHLWSEVKKDYAQVHQVTGAASAVIRYIGEIK